MQAVVHADHRRIEEGADQGQKGDHVGDGAFRHEAPEQKHAEQCQAAADQRQDGQKTLVETELVDHPPGFAGARQRHGAVDEDDDRRAHQYPPRGRIQHPHQACHQEQHNYHGPGENDLFVIGQLAQPDGNREQHEHQAADQDPPVRRRALGLAADHGPGLRARVALAAQARQVAQLQPAAQGHAEYRDQGNQQGELEDIDVDLRLVCLGHGLDAAELVDVEQRHRDAAADNGDPPQRLHGGVHQAQARRVDGLAGVVDARYRFHGHGVDDYVLHHVADRGEQGAGDVPRRQRHDLGHARRLAEQADHDQQAERDQPGAEEHQPGLESPDEIHQVAERHLERPGDVGPEQQGGEEFRRQAQVVLDEEGADNAGQTGNAVGGIDHQRGQERQPQFAPEFQYIAIEPPVEPAKHLRYPLVIPGIVPQSGRQGRSESRCYQANRLTLSHFRPSPFSMLRASLVWNRIHRSAER